MSKSVNVDFVTRQIEVDTDGKEHFISAAMAAKDAEAAATNAQNAANTAEKIATDLGLVDEAVQTAVASATTASEQSEIATAKADIATTKASEANTSATTATQKANEASVSASNAAQSYANADAIASQLTEYLNTKEEVTAPAVDKTLLIAGAAADSKVVGLLKDDLRNLSPLNLNYSKLNLLAIESCLNGNVAYNKNLSGYSTTTYLPDIYDGKDIVITLSTSKMEKAGITGIKWEKGTSAQSFVLYTENIKAFNSVVPPPDYEAPATSFDYICLSLPKDKPYIYIKSDLNNVAIEKNIKKWIDISDLKDNTVESISHNTNDKYISSCYVEGTYEGDVDGSVVVRFPKTTNEFEAFLSLSDNYDYDLIRFWENGSPWNLLKTYKYRRGGIEVIIPQNCNIVQINATKAITTGNPIDVKIEKLLLEPRVKMLENITSRQDVIASVNMFNSIGAIGDSYTQGSAKNSNGEWYQLTNQSWIGTLAKRSGVVFGNYGLGGATTRSYIVDKLQDVLNDSARDLYFFALGQNDANQNIPIGSIADINDGNWSLNADTFFGNYGKIIAQVKAHSPNAKVVFIKNWLRGEIWVPYDTAIEEIAAHYAAPVINPFDDFLFGSPIYLNYFIDGHPTALGYSMMGLAMERLFSKCVMDNPTYFQFSTIG